MGISALASEPAAVCRSLPATAQSQSDFKACVNAIKTLSRKQQTALVNEYLLNGHHYIPNEAFEDIIASLPSELARRMEAVYLALTPSLKEGYREKLARLQQGAIKDKDMLALGYMWFGQAEHARLNRDKAQQGANLDKAEKTALDENILGLMPYIQMRRGDIIYLERDYASARTLYNLSLSGFLASSNKTQAGNVCIKIGYTTARVKSISDDSLLSLARTALATGKGDAACLLAAIAYRAHQNLDDTGIINEFGNASIEAANSVGYKPMVPSMLNILATNAKRNGDYGEAVNYYQRAVEAYDAIGNDFMAAAVSVNVGIILLDLGNTDEAISKFTTGLDIIEEKAPDRKDASLKAMRQIAKAHAKAERHEDAALWYERALRENKIQPVPYFDGMIEADFARTLYELGQTERALAMASQAADRLIGYGDKPDKPEAASILAWLGLRYLDGEDLQKAEDALHKAETLMDPEGKGADILLTSSGNLNTKIDFARGMADVMTALGQAEKSARYARVALELSETRFAEEKIQAVANADLKWDLRDRDRNLALMEREAEISDLSLRQSQLRNIVFLSSTLAIGLFAILLWRSHLNQRHLLVIKDTFLSEIHHRVSNNMQLLSSLLSMDARQYSNKNGIARVAEDAANRARTMALIHTHIYNYGQTTKIKAPVFFSELALLLNDGLGRDEIRIRTDIDSVELDINQVTPMGLLVCEAVTNSFKYAFPNKREGEVSITLSAQDDKLCLTVADNGNGCEKPIRKNSSGMNIMSDLSTQLGGAFNFQSSSSGTVISIEKIPALIKEKKLTPA